MIYIKFIAFIYAFFSTILSTDVCDPISLSHNTTLVGEYGNSYRIQNSLTNGGCGAIFVAINLNTRMKAIIKRSLELGNNEKIFNRELNNMKIMKNWHSTKNLVVAEDFYDSRKSTNEHTADSWISFKYYPKGDVLEFAKNKGFLYLSEIRTILYDTLVGLNELHSRGYAHFDIKLENLIVSSSTETSVHVKIIDFGFMREKKEYSSLYMVGSRRYMSPEILNISYFRPGDYCDIWSLGAIAVYLKAMSNNVPELDLKYLKKFYENKWYYGFYSRIKSLIGCMHFTGEFFQQKELENFCDLVIGMLNFVPNQRFTAAEALNHPFFASLKSNGAPNEYSSMNPTDRISDFEASQKDSSLVKGPSSNEAPQKHSSLLQDLSFDGTPEIVEDPSLREASQDFSALVNDPTFNETPENLPILAEDSVFKEAPQKLSALVDNPTFNEAPQKHPRLIEDPSFSLEPQEISASVESPTFNETPQKHPIVIEDPSLSDAPQKHSTLLKDPTFSETFQNDSILVEDPSLSEAQKHSALLKDSTFNETIQNDSVLLEKTDLNEVNFPKINSIKLNKYINHGYLTLKLLEHLKSFNPDLEAYLAADQGARYYSIYFPKANGSESFIYRTIEISDIIQEHWLNPYFVRPQLLAFEVPYVAYYHHKSNFLYSDLIGSRLSINDLKYILVSILKGMEAIHRLGYFYFILDPSHLQLDHSQGYITAKIHHIGYLTNSSDAWMNLKNVNINFVAPEIFHLNSVVNAAACDMWSVGATIHFFKAQKGLFSNVKFDPRNFKTSQKKLRKILGCNYGSSILIEKLCRTTKFNSICYCDLILKLLRYDPNQRITATQALQHPFLEKITNRY